MIKNYIFLGAPGVGKGTVAMLLEKHKGIKHISTGEIFRQNVKFETKLGLQVKKIINEGGYVPDELTNELVKDTLLSEEIKHTGFILDGYPRTEGQAQFLKDNGFDITAAVHLKASDETVMQRLLSRARGSDDTPMVIKERMKIYNELTLPLIKFYEEEKLLVEVNAEGTIDENYAAVEKALY